VGNSAANVRLIKRAAEPTHGTPGDEESRAAESPPLINERSARLFAVFVAFRDLEAIFISRAGRENATINVRGNLTRYLMIKCEACTFDFEKMIS